LEWAAGWFNDTWTGADGIAPETAFACAGANVAAVYKFAREAHWSATSQAGPTSPT